MGQLNNEWNLKFTLNMDETTLPFLNLTIGKDPEGIISTNLFRKPTAGNSLLHVESVHPRHAIRGIPMGQYKQLCRNCS